MCDTQRARERVLAAINHTTVDRIPVMYRGLPETDAKLCDYFGLGPVGQHWTELAERLGADLFSGGSSMGRYARVSPKYIGPLDDGHSLYHLDYVWGLIPQQAAAATHTYINWIDHPMASFSSVRQSGMMMSPVHWNRYLKKWYETLYADAKKYALKVLYHCCGSFHPIIPTLIDIGVDILDPVQTSALEMDLKTLKRKYGNNVCWHGGIDVQRLLPYGTVSAVRDAVREAEELFRLDGGIVLGPSHEITPDTPIENILAMYDV